MKDNYLIIGLTGPLGSGCGTVAKFLATELNEFAGDAKRMMLPTIEDRIGMFHRHLQKMRMLTGEQFLPHNDFRITPDELSTKIDNNNNLPTLGNKKKELNRQLRALLDTRLFLRVFSETEWPDFTTISMSDMIIKLALRNALDENAAETDSFRRSDILSIDAKAKFTEFAQNHYTVIRKYDNRLRRQVKHSRKTLVSSLGIDELKEYDNLITGIGELKNKIDITNRSYREQWLQDFGDNLRATGDAFSQHTTKDKFLNKNLNIISREVYKFIKLMRRRKDGKSSQFFVIDSFRRPMPV